MSALPNLPTAVSEIDALKFMEANVPLIEISMATRQRFKKILKVLFEAGINKHNQSHQFRTALNTTRIMMELDFDRRAIVQAIIGALMHDIAYHKPDTKEKGGGRDDYNTGKKAHFMKHALNGAREIERLLNGLLKRAKRQGDRNPKLQKLLSYKNEEGSFDLMNEEDIRAITEAILNHNDYGKDDMEYDPRTISKGALVVQLSDKMDHSRQRVYKTQMKPEVFKRNKEGYDNPKCVHQIVPYCIKSYEFSINKEEGTMEWVYKVDMTDFIDLMKKADSNFVYSKKDYVRDFEAAYTKNSEVAAEAIGLILAKTEQERVELKGKKTLIVKLQFPDGEEEIIEFARPEKRPIYTQAARETRSEVEGLMAVEA